MEKQGQFVWNFRDGKIKFEDGDWLELQNEEALKRIRRVFVIEDTLIPLSGNAKANVSVTHGSARDRPFVGLLEKCKDPVLHEIVFTSSLLPARFTDIQVSLINLGNKTQWIPKGTELGILHEAHVLKIPLKNNKNEELRIRTTKSGWDDPDEVSAPANPMAGWARRRCDGMRRLGEEYQETLAELGLLDDILLVQTKEVGAESHFEWCMDCREPPDNTRITVSKISHRNRPKYDETSSSCLLYTSPSPRD